MALTPKQELFVKEFLIDLNATQAAIRCGYSKKTAGQQGEQLLKKLEIAQAVRSAMEKRSGRLEITQDRVLLEYARIAFFDIRKLYREDGTLKAPGEWDDDSAAAVCGLEVLEEFEYSRGERELIGHVKKVKTVDKKGALDSVAKHLGMFRESVGDEDAPPPTRVEIVVKDARK